MPDSTMPQDADLRGLSEAYAADQETFAEIRSAWGKDLPLDLDQHEWLLIMAEKCLRLVGAYRAGRLIEAPDPSSRPGGAVGAREIVRHVKRGTEYEVLGEAEAQVSAGPDNIPMSRAAGGRYLRDGIRVIVYRSLDDGKLWCRFPDEFRDGRFVTVSEPPAIPAAATASKNSAGQTYTQAGKLKVETQELAIGSDRPLLQIREGGFSIGLDAYQWAFVREAGEAADAAAVVGAGGERGAMARVLYALRLSCSLVQADAEWSSCLQAQYKLDALADADALIDAGYGLKVSALPAEGVGWRPIETAPLGEPFLAFGGVSIMGGRAVGMRVSIADDRDDFYRGDGTPRPSAPTHWMPLPEPPADPAGADGGVGGLGGSGAPAAGEVGRLVDRLCNSPGRTLVNFNVFPGEAAERGELSADEVAAEINRALDRMERGEVIARLPGRWTRKQPRDVRDLLAEALAGDAGGGDGAAGAVHEHAAPRSGATPEPSHPEIPDNSPEPSPSPPSEIAREIINAVSTMYRERGGDQVPGDIRLRHERMVIDALLSYGNTRAKDMQERAAGVVLQHADASGRACRQAQKAGLPNAADRWELSKASLDAVATAIRLLPSEADRC